MHDIVLRSGLFIALNAQEMAETHLFCNPATSRLTDNTAFIRCFVLEKKDASEQIIRPVSCHPMSILPSDTPRLPQWPFLLGDAVLLACAALLATYAPATFSNSVILTIALCVALAAILGVIPFLADYANKQDEALDERQRGLEALTRTVADAAEQISVAANSLHKLTDLARQQLAQAEALPKHVEENIQKINLEFSAIAASAEESLRHEIKTLRTSETRKLDDAAAKIQKILNDLEKVGIQTTAGSGEKNSRVEFKDRLPNKPIVTTSDSSATSNQVRKPTVEDSGALEKPLQKAEPEVIGQPTDLIETTTEAVSPPPQSLPINKQSAQKKPKPILPEKPALISNHNDEVLTLTGEDENPEMPKTITSDGATRLFVTAYIGIGNRLFIRGDGAGLSPDKGVPLQFVSIGKWQWESKDATKPLHVSLYKNDEIECLSPGALNLEPGHQVEVSASF